MRKVLFPAPTEGVWVRWEDHIAETLAIRDKLLEIAKECASCGGTGLWDYDERVEECPHCDDIRSVLA